VTKWGSSQECADEKSGILEKTIGVMPHISRSKDKNHLILSGEAESNLKKFTLHY
jgi:hypothetical protein